ncbi:g6859 [Coccomyxa viridis]|uniref:G6859 protein n=1 Tax=Coccomyxa viridis TaxID=1274662 RepID=A0ABP1FWE8_9CHLO
MSVKIAQPTAEDAKKYPREYAIFTQIPGALHGSVKSEDVAKAVKEFGSGSAPSEGDLSFEQLAKALHKGTTAEFGSGNTVGYATKDDSGHLAPWAFDRRPVGEEDISIQIAYAGICHSDLHQIKNEWGNSKFPMVPGHEIVGIVTEVGSKAGSHFKVGDRAGIGCFVRACQNCELCKIGDDQYCTKVVMTYNGDDWGESGSNTMGGYSNRYVVNHKFALKVPENLPLVAAAPLLCAGITTYSPMKHFGLDKKGQKLAVVGLGGLGHMAVKFGKGFGMEVTVISTSPKKEKEAINTLGADHFVVSKDEAQMSAVANTFDGIIDTVSAQHDISQLLPLLKTNGHLVLLGVPPSPHSFAAGSLLFKRLTIAGSLIGGIKETQEMLDFCGKNNITCDVEEIDASYVNTAMDRLVKNDVHYRFSINVLNSIVA